MQIQHQFCSIQGTTREVSAAAELELLYDNRQIHILGRESQKETESKTENQSNTGCKEPLEVNESHFPPRAGPCQHLIRSAVTLRSWAMKVLKDEVSTTLLGNQF